MEKQEEIFEFNLTEPIYLQIKEFIKQRIIDSTYLPGCFLPSIKSLALQLGVTTNTLQRAYMDLIYEGLLISIRGKGYQLIDDEKKIKKFREGEVKGQFENLLIMMGKMGFCESDVTQLFLEFMNKHKQKK